MKQDWPKILDFWRCRSGAADQALQIEHCSAAPDMLSFQKKNAGQRATTSFYHAIFARRTHIYITVNKKIQFNGMVCITVLTGNFIIIAFIIFKLQDCCTHTINIFDTFGLELQKKN